jgi:hypothetical protein
MIFSFYHCNTSVFLGQNCWDTWGEAKNGAQNDTKVVFGEKWAKVAIFEGKGLQSCQI